MCWTKAAKTAISERCRLPKSTVTRLTYTLTRLGYLHHVEESGRYRLGMATLMLGGTTLARLDVKEMSRPLMQQLAIDTGTQVSLGLRDEMSMLYIENCRGHSIVTLRLDIGARIPLATTAMGRAYLAAAPENVRLALEERIQALDPIAWPRIEKGLRQACADLAESGCVGSFGEWQKEINGIAVPFQPGGGLPLMVINAAGPAQSMSRDTLLGEVRPKLIAMVREIEQGLGARR
jgi:DNA-binding IclR family transcriptional regulator